MSHPAPKKKKTAVVIGIIAMAAVIIIGIIAAVKMFGSSDAKETAKDSTYKEVKENAAEKESKPAKKENVKPKKETDGEMKKDSGQEEKDNSKREAVLTDPVTMGWAGTYKDDDSGDRLVIASIGYEWSYVIYTSSGQIFEKESECGAFGDYLEGQYYTFYKNENYHLNDLFTKHSIPSLSLQYLILLPIAAFSLVSSENLSFQSTLIYLF